MAACRLPYPLPHKRLMAKSEAMRDQKSMHIGLGTPIVRFLQMVGALPPKAGRACVFWSEMLMRSPSSRLSRRTRRQGAAPLGGSLTSAGGIKYFRSHNSPMARRSVTAPMPLKVPMMTGKSASPLFCCWWDV